MTLLKNVLTAASATALLGATFYASAADRFVTIGTGGVTGVYYPTGGAILPFGKQDEKRTRHSLFC